MRTAYTPDHLFTIQLSEVIQLKELSVTVNHDLGSENAKKKLMRRIEELKSDYEGKFTLDSSWKDDFLEFHLKAAGIKTDGYLNVTESEVSVSGTLPVSLAVFRGKIEKTLKAELEKLLSDGD